MNSRTSGSGRAAGFAIVALAALAGGFALGRWSAGTQGAPPASAGEPTATVKEWTCSMHPQIRLPQPGRCPICGMELVPVLDQAGSGGAVVLGEGAQQIASIEVIEVRAKTLEHELRTVGRIVFNERQVAYLTARSDGRVERVFADFTGTHVDRGDHLVEIYAPDLVVAQQELLLALKRSQSAGAEGSALGLELSRDKLALLGITKEQIAQIEASGKPQTTLTVYAPIGGTVIEKHVRQQMYVKAGDPLYSIADLSSVWLEADVYEYELPWIAIGQKVDATVEALPGETFAGTVAFVEPTVNDATRTVRVRIELANQKLALKPGMFASVRVRARLGAGGKRALVDLPGSHACPMHPEVVADEPGKCRICGMQLVERKQMDTTPAELLAVPASAVLDSGLRQVVYVERSPGVFEVVEVQLGPRAGEEYPVLAGLAQGDRVVVRGGFLLDSQSQIQGKPSLLFPKGLATGTGEHAGHAGMQR